MSEQAVHRMTADDFLLWHEQQECRYELIDGVPAAMAGAKRRHDQVVVNALVSLGNQLPVGKFRVFTSDTAVRIPVGNIRYPDVGIDCGRFLDEDRAADAPTLVIEVLSESTRAFDFLTKLEEYKSVPTLLHIILVDTDMPEILHWSRPLAGAWTARTLEGLDAELAVDAGIRMKLRAFYAGLEFRDKPRLVFDDGTPAS